jgi:tRNA 2-thiouridine synthesizing protein C
MYDGVFLINANQNTDHSSLKQFTKAFAALQDFGVDTVLSHDASLAARGLEQHNLMIDTVAVDSDGVRDLIKQQDRVFIF